MQRVQQHDAPSWREAGAFMERLRQNSGVRGCMAFLIPTAARSGEVRGARWSEIDVTRALWTIRAERLKAEREHRVPLSDAAVAVLRDMVRIGSDPGAIVLRGRPAPRPLNDMTLVRTADAAGGSSATVHGFRSAFRDWCAEGTHYPRELAEAALSCRVHAQLEADPCATSYSTPPWRRPRRALSTKKADP